MAFAPASHNPTTYPRTHTLITLTHTHTHTLITLFLLHSLKRSHLAVKITNTVAVLRLFFIFNPSSEVISIISMSRSVDVHDHYLNCGVPDEIAENLKEFFPDEDGLSYEEVLLQQASMYQSFKECEKNKHVATNDDNVNKLGRFLEDKGESSRHECATSQEALDEALARSLQELGDGFDEFLISEHNGSTSGSRESPIASPPRAHASISDSRHDSVDPDTMRYEELVNLTETIGVENRGISEARISRLPTSKYRSGFLSMNKKNEENCVICQMSFNFGERLITLPCSHRYHAKCITKWLKLKKNCPICKKEVV